MVCCYRIARDFYGDFNLANFFTKTHELMRMSVTHVIACIIVCKWVACGAHVFAKLISFLDQFTNFNTRQNSQLYGRSYLVIQ